MNKGKKAIIISVIGGSEPPPEAEALAEQVGRELAKKGAIVACGGLTGVMEAACRGAKAAGGTTIGILPGRDSRHANQWVDIPICTDIGYARNAIVAYTGEAVIAVDGSYGTLSEISYALRVDIPVVGLQTWSFSRNGELDCKMIIARDAVDAVEKALEAAKERDRSRSAQSRMLSG